MPTTTTTTTNGSRNGSSSSAREIGALSARVDTLSTEVHGIRQSIGSLHAKLDERRSIPWGGVTAGIALIALMGGVVVFAISAYVSAVGSAIAGEREARIEAEERIVEELSRVAAIIVPRAELDDRRELSGQRIERAEMDIQRLIASTYPREVHLERWSAFTAELDHVREEIKTVRDDVNAISPTGNVLDSLAERIERLESRWIDRRMDNDGPPIP